MHNYECSIAMSTRHGYDSKTSSPVRQRTYAVLCDPDSPSAQIVSNSTTVDSNSVPNDTERNTERNTPAAKRKRCIYGTYTALYDPDSPSGCMVTESTTSLSNNVDDKPNVDSPASKSTTPAQLRRHVHPSSTRRLGESKRKMSKTQMTRASCKRASRAARACDPSSEATTQAHKKMYEEYKRISAIYEKAPTFSSQTTRFLFSSASGGKGAAVRTSEIHQGKMNHLSTLKSKDVDAKNTEPAFLLGGYTAPLKWDRLAEDSLKSNAVNSSVTDRKSTEGAASQTTRISCRAIGQAAASQLCATALAMAHGRRLMRNAGMSVVNPMATNAVNLCGLALTDVSGVRKDKFFCITSTNELVYNSCPVKLSAVSVISVCTELARRELDSFYISNAMGTRTSALVDMCDSITRKNDLDAVWCSWILVNYLCSHPRGRDLLRGSGLTDVDIQSAIAFERYGGEEIGKRVRQRNSQLSCNRKRPRCDANTTETDDVSIPCQRRRTSKGPVAFNVSDSYSILEFWHNALQSQDKSVLYTLAAHNKHTARDAALSTLQRQTQGTDIVHNEVLRNMSMQNAIKSATALVSFVGRRVEEIPSILLCDAKDASSGNMKTVWATTRISNEAANSALHACTLPPLGVRPPMSVGIAIAWSHATTKLLPSSEISASLSTVLERYQRIAEIEGNEPSDRSSNATQRRPATSRVSARTMREIDVLQQFIDSESDGAICQQMTGTTRSFLSIATFLCINDTHKQAGASLFQEAEQLKRQPSVSQYAELGQLRSLPKLIAKSQNNNLRTVEPLCTPSSPLAVGINSNETLRRWMTGKTRRNDPCMKLLGFSSHQEVSKDMPSIMSSEPLPLLTITDVEIECIGDATQTYPNTNHVVEKVPVSVGIHVCADGAARVPEVVDRLFRKLKNDAVKVMRESRAALFVASSQASFIGCVSSALTSGYTNTSVANSKKISVPDVNKLMLLTPYDCYVAGLCNIERSYDGTAYSGTYGCRLDTGFTMHGLLAHNFRSDKRQHGNCQLSERAANELALAFGESHWIVYKGTKEEGAKDGGTSTTFYTSTPISTRGIPHNFVPGVHTLLRDYCSFIESCRSITGRSECDTVDSIMSLPFGPFTQALNPDLEPTADVSLRSCVRNPAECSAVTGRAYLPDATSEEDAIVKEPLFRRPCQVSSGDCPFGTSYEAIDTFFNASSTLALLAKVCARQKKQQVCTSSECVALLHDTITKFVSGQAAQNPRSHTNKEHAINACWAADALVLINVLYPSCLEVGKLALLKGVALAAPACQRGLDHAPVLHLHCVPKIQDKDVEAVRTFWSAFCRKDTSTCAWAWGLAPLLTLILDHNGSHKLTQENIKQFRTALENASRAVWLVYSADGQSPPPKWHPAHDAPSPMQVSRHHIDPIFVGNKEAGSVQRGSTVGIKPHSYRQVLAELLGARIQGVECNVALNEGGMGLRVSCDPTILKEDGKERTDKSISPVQTEGDESAYGKREDKIAGAVAQKNAWDSNAIMCKPLYTSIEPPMNAEMRRRGEFGCAQELRAYRARMQNEQQRVDESVERSLRTAKCMMKEAAVSDVPRCVHEAMSRQ